MKNQRGGVRGVGGMRGMRGKRKNKKSIKKDLRLMGVNSAGLRPKIQSLKKVLSDLEPSIFFLEETKCKTMGSIKLKNYIVFEQIRPNQYKGGGGGGVVLG